MPSRPRIRHRGRLTALRPPAHPSSLRDHCRKGLSTLPMPPDTSPPLHAVPPGEPNPALGWITAEPVVSDRNGREQATASSLPSAPPRACPWPVLLPDPSALGRRSERRCCSDSRGNLVFPVYARRRAEACPPLQRSGPGRNNR